MNAAQRRTTEGQRLSATKANTGWKHWGPYLPERQWGTVREDYSASGDAWNTLSYDTSRLYAYRWGEDGLAGFADVENRVCLSLALWNHQDDHLKEKLFGLANSEGNHGEDVKEIYYYLDSTPTHSYCKMQYLYPQAAFPYADLRQQNKHVRGKHDAEYELADTGVLDGNRYFEVNIEYAKVSEDDLVATYTVTNRGPVAAPLTVIPQITLRNTWSYDHSHPQPQLSLNDDATVTLTEPHQKKDYTFYAPEAQEYLFTDNETNTKWLYGDAEGPQYTKEAFHRYFTQQDHHAVRPQGHGTKVGAVHQFFLAAGETKSISIRLADHAEVHNASEIPETIATRQDEADAFYHALQSYIPSEADRRIQRQAIAGMLWSKQFYYYDVADWLDGDPGKSPPPASRLEGRNQDWRHLSNADLISMPDKWEYPWYAAWDLAFHCIPYAMVDADFAKRQLVLMLKEWYQHPNGQIPAYEWNFSDVNPPVHAWACYRVFKMDLKRTGEPDYFFLERVFHKLMINFTWWVNQKDKNGNNVFQGGFLGLDNIGLFDRSAPLPNGGYIDQADGTAWMAFYALGMMKIALQLAQQNSVYEDTATKFFEHFLHIAEALNSCGTDGQGLWDEEDGFYYDILHQNGKSPVKLKVRSMVGIIPLFAVEVLDEEMLEKVPHFKRRMQWTFEHRPELARHVGYQRSQGQERHLLSLVNKERLERILSRLFDPDAFFSDYGIRSLSKEHLTQPYRWNSGKLKGEVAYIPGESDSGMFGGNSNWRGPIWFPLNFLLYESLEKTHYYYQNELSIDAQSESNLDARLKDLADRLTNLFRPQDQHTDTEDAAAPSPRPCHQGDPFAHQHPLFYEYFHGDSGKGLGAAHQTGWTGLIAKLIDSTYKPNSKPTQL